MPIVEHQRRSKWTPPPPLENGDSSSRSEREYDRPIYVMKFGGTSVGSAERIEEISDIIAKNTDKAIVVVVSAMSGITNALTELASEDLSIQNREKTLRMIIERHGITATDLRLFPERRFALKSELNSLYRLMRGDVENLMLTGGERKDRILSYGERLSSRLVSTKLLQRGIKAHSFDSTGLIVTDDNFGEAHPDKESTEKKVQESLIPLLKDGMVPVVTGFLGSSPDGRITTLGRGGSDFSATYLGGVLHAKEVWIWTDVDGVYDKDPRIHPDAQIFPRLSFEDADRMAKEGAKVLHKKTLDPLVNTNTIVRVKNTFNPSYPGTEIVPSL